MTPGFSTACCIAARSAARSARRSPFSLAANLDAQRTIITRTLCARVSAESERGLPSLPTSLPRHRLRRWVGVGERSPTPGQDLP